MSIESRPAADPDAELMLRFKAGDLGAFERLFSRHVRSLVGFAFRFVRNRDIAEELAQDIFLRVHDAAPGYRADAKFTTWLFRIATNVCLNEMRRPQYRAIHDSLDTSSACTPEARLTELADSARIGAHALLEQRAISEALKAALEKLPEKQRVAFILSKYQDLSYAEVAEVMQTSEKAVKALIHRAKEAMADLLKPLLQELL